MRLTSAIAMACALYLARVVALAAGAAAIAEDRPPAYLEGAQIPVVAELLGPPPSDGSGTKAGDVATFRSTRSLQGSPRWTLAASDAEYGAAPMLRDFSCALAVQLNQANAPALYRLLARLTTDASDVELPAKNHYKRPRPFVEVGGAICVAPDAWLAKSYSYPSGHSTYSWVVALVLDEIAPDRSTAILTRARTYGESRVVCGVHYASDVQAGRVAATALFGALQADPAFRQDLEAARAELARLRSARPAEPDRAQCKLEATAIGHPVW